jgi:hypothetical protein
MSEANGNGRDPITGRALPGNRLSIGNKGANPLARRMNELRRLLTEAATEDDIRDIYRSLLAAAKSGDVAAARLLLDHLIGRPKESIEVSAGDGQSIGLEVIMKAVLAALEPFPEARLAVAAKLKEVGEVGRGHDDGPCDRVGD